MISWNDDRCRPGPLRRSNGEGVRAPGRGPVLPQVADLAQGHTQAGSTPARSVVCAQANSHGISSAGRDFPLAEANLSQDVQAKFSSPDELAGCRGIVTGVLMGLVFWLLLAATLWGQEPNTIVDVQLVGTSQHQVMEAILRDSTLLLPARDLFAFLGLESPTSAWTTPQALGARFPTITVTWLPRELRALVDDPQEVLPATRRFRETQQREARGAPSLTFTRSGPFLAFAGDDRGRSLVDLGYSWRGRVAVTGRQSSTQGTAWAVSLSPTPKVFLAYSDGASQTPSASGRLATGPMWLSTSWTPTRWSVDGLVVLGRVSVFASSREVYLVTIKGPGGDLQLGRSAGRTAARISWGPIPASPFSFPQVP